MKKKTIVKPGHHIEPKWDLKGLRKRKNSKGRLNVTADLPLVSIIDLFSILVIYLLMNFSATGDIFFTSKEIHLPSAKHATAIHNAPLITITTDDVRLEALSAQSNSLLTLSDVNSKTDPIGKLISGLREFRKIQEIIHPDQVFKGQVNIQADESVPLVNIKLVMRTCILEGWTGINFAVIEKD